MHSATSITGLLITTEAMIAGKQALRTAMVETGRHVMPAPPSDDGEVWFEPYVALPAGDPGVRAAL